MTVYDISCHIQFIQYYLIDCTTGTLLLIKHIMIIDSNFNWLWIIPDEPCGGMWCTSTSVYPFPLRWLRECTLCLIIIIKSEVWTIIHGLALGHETIICAVCLSIFLLSWWPHGMDRVLAHHHPSVTALGPSDVMYGWVSNTWLHILPTYSFCCSSVVDLFELLFSYEWDMITCARVLASG